MSVGDIEHHFPKKVGLTSVSTLEGIVHMLNEHPTGLPGETIESVTIFTTEGGRYYHLLFTLTD